MYPEFDAADLPEWLHAASSAELNQLSFGVVGMALDGTVVAYNSTEAMLSGLTASRVIGRHFFTSVAPCTNNYLVAHRFETEPEMDATINYVFTLRMAPQPVHLRLLKSPQRASMFLAVRRRPTHDA